MDGQEDSEKRERVLLRPWLENLIESGTILGLEWIDDVKTTFKVPWKHRSKKTWSLRHSSIFLEWAKNTGRWSEGDPEPNYAQLKTRLRCAFNKAPDIEEMKELHRTKSEEPYKVYKFIPRKDSKLYPFGRRPLRKTTVPITIRRRRYLISRISLGSGSGRFGMSDGSAIHRVKQEKEDIADMNCVELATDRGFSVTTDSKDWAHSTWLTDKERASDLGSSGSWSSMYDQEADGGQTVNRILPLIVEEENYNSSASFDLDLPPSDHRHESKAKRSIVTQMSRDSINSHEDESMMISIPKVLTDDPVNVSLPFYHHQTILPSPILASEKREFCRTYDNVNRLHDSTAIYVSSPSVDLPRSDSFNSGDNHPRILPRAEDYLQAQATKYHGAKQPTSGANSFLAPEQWGHRGVAENRHPMKKRSFESIQEHPFKQSSADLRDGPVPERRPSLLPAARFFPLKNRYILSQNAFCTGSEASTNGGDVIPGQRQNAVVKPNAVSQPQVAVATPYDGKPRLEDEPLSIAGGIPENVNRDLLKKYVESNESDGQPTELEVMDLSTKLPDKMDSESKVLDLTKKMVVTPFERDCHANSSPGVSKSNLVDSGKESLDNLLSSDPAALSSTVGEILKFKADYKRKKQLIVTKTMLLMEKERELKAREKQLAAREEALYWKESYLHKVMVGTDVGAVQNITTVRNGIAGPFNSVFEASLPIGPFVSNEMNAARSSGNAHPILPHFQQTSPIIMSAVSAAGARNRIPIAARPELPNFMPYYQASSRPMRPHQASSVTSDPSASLHSNSAISVSMKSARLGEVGDQNSSQKAVGCTVLPSVKRSVSNETSDAGLEPEANVALGDANPGRKSYCYSTEKTESEFAVALGAGEDVSGQTMMMVRKRGRPKGSKNKNKLSRLNGDSAFRQMPPLLIIRSPPPLKDFVGLDPSASKSLPFHLLRNPSMSGISLNASKSTDAGMRDVESTRNLHPTTITIGSNSYSATRILPPVSSNSSGDHSSPQYGMPTPEVSNSTPASSASLSLFDHLPNREVMPETVRQLLMSASKPVSNILPPLSPPKSPEEFSHEIPADSVNLCEEEGVR